MKQKLSITIEEKKVKLLEKLLKQGMFRNKSHIIEYSIDRFLEKQKLLQSEKNLLEKDFRN